MYLIGSTLARSVFIDEKRNAYIFTVEQEARDFISKIPDTDILPAPEKVDTSVFSDCFAAGAEILRERNGNGMEIEHVLREEKLEKRFYNESLNADITRYKHTRNVVYLKALKDCSFIVPVRITNEPYTKIVYATARRSREGEEEYAFLAFTDLTEYDKWTEKDNGWKPLLIDHEVMMRIGHTHGFILDVYRTGFYITTKMLSKHIAGERNND